MPLKQIQSQFIETQNHVRKIEERIVMRKKQIERLETKKAKTQVFWITGLIKPIAKALEEVYPNRVADVLGPFGLDAETAIHLYKKGISNEKRFDDDNCISITFRPGNIEQGILYIKDTRHNTRRFQKGTIGELNGMNYKSIEFDWNLNTLVELINEFNSHKGGVDHDED